MLDDCAVSQVAQVTAERLESRLAELERDAEGMQSEADALRERLAAAEAAAAEARAASDTLRVALVSKVLGDGALHVNP